MMIEKKQLESELAGLQKQLQEHLDNINAVQGAIQLCEHFLSLEAEESPSPADGSQSNPSNPADSQ